MVIVDCILCHHRDAPSVESQPTVAIRSWQVVTTADGEARLAGVLENGYTWRVTSPLVVFNPSTRCITTSSGRRYELNGPPAVSGLDVIVIAAQLAMNGLARAKNTSEWYQQAMADAVH